MGRDRILVVEDDPTLLETICYNLERQGYEVFKARDGLLALEKARKKELDLILERAWGWDFAGG